MKTHLTFALQLCFVLVAGVTLSACMKQAPLKDQDITDVYVLVSVNGKPMPATLIHEGAALEIRSGTFTINSDGTCSTKTVFVPPSGAEITHESSATFTKDGSKLAMQWKGAGKTVGAIQGNIFSMDNEGMALVYRKQ